MPDPWFGILLEGSRYVVMTVRDASCSSCSTIASKGGSHTRKPESSLALVAWENGAVALAPPPCVRNCASPPPNVYADETQKYKWLRCCSSSLLAISPGFAEVVEVLSWGSEDSLKCPHYHQYSAWQVLHFFIMVTHYERIVARCVIDFDVHVLYSTCVTS
jgi:hypothetical protein